MWFGVRVDGEVDCLLPSNVSNLFVFLQGHEVELAVRVVKPDWVYHRIALRVDGPKPQRRLRAGEKNLNLSLFHAGSIGHGPMHLYHCR